MNINLTLIIQMVVFAILIWFTMKFVWPMIIGAMIEREKKIAAGLAAAEQGQKDLSEAKSRAEENKKGLTIKYNIPKEGGVMYFDNMAVPADASHVKNAHIFINYMLRAEVAAKNSNFISFANSNPASWPLVNPEVKQNPGIFPTPEMMTKLVPDLPETAEFTRSLTRTWTRFRTGK